MYVPIDKDKRHVILYDNAKQSQMSIRYLIDSDNLKMEQQYRNVYGRRYMYMSKKDVNAILTNNLFLRTC